MYFLTTFFVRAALASDPCAAVLFDAEAVGHGHASLSFQRAASGTTPANGLRVELDWNEVDATYTAYSGETSARVRGGITAADDWEAPVLVRTESGDLEAWELMYLQADITRSEGVESVDATLWIAERLPNGERAWSSCAVLGWWDEYVYS